jgi:hypothetical protein
VLLQHGADPNIRNTDGKSALDLADPSAKAVLTGKKAERELPNYFICGITSLIFIKLTCTEYFSQL